MLRFYLRMEFGSQMCGEAAGVLRSLVGPVRAEAGCLATRLVRDAEDEGVVTWVEEWRGIEHFQQHLRADTFRQIVAVMELASVTPAVEIDDVASRRGFELVEEILADKPGLVIREG